MAAALSFMKVNAGNLSLAATDRFLQQAADDPPIGGDKSGRGYRIGIDLAGEALLGLAKCIAHDVLENLISKKTLAFGSPITSEMRMARQINC
jgi:hypothetical protein